MIANNDDQVKPETAPPKTPCEPRKTRRQLAPEEFFARYDVGVPGLVQCIVTNGSSGNSNYHTWKKPEEDFAAFAVKQSNKSQRAYFSMAAYDPAMGVSTFKGRTAKNAMYFKSFWLDIDVLNCVDKDGVAYTHGTPESTYPDHESAVRGLASFIKATGVRVSDLVSTGSGGLQVYFCLDAAITKTEWLPRALALRALATNHGLKIDAPCTTNPAQIMRAPGSFHNKTANLVVAYRLREELYTLEVFDKLVGYVPGTETPTITGLGNPPSYALRMGINGDVVGPLPKYSYMQAAEKCGAMRLAAHRNGRDTPYPVWYLAARAAALSIEGREYAHEISSGHEDYDRAETDKKIDSLTGGPAGCGAWADAYGAGGPCETCEWRGKIKNPAVQLGTEGSVVADEVIDGGQVASVDLSMPDWVTRRVEDDEGKWHTRKIRPHNTSANVEALANSKGWSIQYNVMSKRTELTGDGVVVAGDDADNVALTLFGDDAVRAGLARDGLGALVDAVAVGNSYHPVLNWIESNPWDGQDRLPMFYDTLTLADSRKAELTRKLMDKWMLQGIGALVEPKGITASGLLVLTGPQYIGKSWWAAHLIDGVLNAVGTGLGLDPKEKDSVLKAVRFFISELAELDGTFRRADIAALKGFLTDGVDVVRLPYARRDTPFARRTIFCASVNDDRYLVDETGNRRFWTIPVTRCSVLPAPAMQQVWAQYLHKYKEGERWVLDPALLAELNESNLDHEVIDPLRERIATRWDWGSVDWSGMKAEHWSSTPDLAWKTASDVCLDVGIERPSRAEATRVGGVIRDLSGGITFARKSHGVKLLAVPKRVGSST